MSFYAKYIPPGAGGGGTVTSITAGSGLTGGTITTSGTIALDQSHLVLNGSTSGSFTQAAANTTTSYSVKWPAAQGATNTFLQNDGAGNLSWTVNGSGDVSGPSSATDNAVTRFDGTTGKIIQNSTVIIDDSGNTTANNLILSATTASTVPYLDASKQLTSSSVTPTQLSYVDFTSSGQTQLNGKQTTITAGSTDNAILTADGTGGTTLQGSSATVADNGALAINSVGTSGYTQLLQFVNDTGTTPMINWVKDTTGNNAGLQFSANGSITMSISNSGKVSAPASFSPGGSNAMFAGNFLQLAQTASDITTPPSAFQVLYFKTDNNLYMRDPSGTVTQVNTPSGANTSLSNLTTTSINKDLIGNTGSPWVIHTTDQTSITASENVTVRSGTAQDGNSGDTVFGSGNTTATGNSGAATFGSGTTVGTTSGVSTFKSGSASSGGTSGEVFFGSGDAAGASSQSGVTNILTGASVAVTGELNISTGNSSGDVSGTINIETGTSGTSHVSGDVNISSGIAGSGAESGFVEIFNGNHSSTGQTGIDIDGANNSGTGLGGYVTIQGGQGSGGGAGGDVTVQTTPAEGGGASGNVLCLTGGASTTGSNTSGRIDLTTGSAASTSGNLTLTTGSAPTRGTINLKADVNNFFDDSAIKISNQVLNYYYSSTGPAITYDSTNAADVFTFLTTNISTNAQSANMTFFTGDNTGIVTIGNSATGDYYVNTGNVTNASSAGNTGQVGLTSGNNSGTGQTGAATLNSGNAIGITGPVALGTGASSGSSSGGIQLATGTAGGSGNSGEIDITTGNTNSSTGNSGNIILHTGPAGGGGVQGYIQFNSLVAVLPTGTTDPSTSYPDGSSYYNTSTNQLRVLNGGTWRGITLT